MLNRIHPPTFYSFYSLFGPSSRCSSVFSLPLGLLFLICLLVSQVSIASDLAKEKRWADQVVESLLDGEAVYLNDGTSDFLTIDTRADEPKDVGIIVIHGIGIHPDWETVIRPIRVELAAEGWNTLSLQMPILGNEATGADYEPLMKEVPARIDAGIRHMFKNGAKKIIIVAHSLGTHMTNYYLAHKKVYKEAQTETPIIAYVAIGMGAGSSDFLKKINLPMLDLYGEKDLPGVISSAPERLKSATHNKKYTQKKVAGANHFFEDLDEDLVNAVKEALNNF